jgi:RNA polymerase sigma-70 factor (ECF subfamily)
MQTFGGDVLRFCNSMLGERALAEDVHQATFVQAFQALKSYSGEGTLRAWLFAIARHRCLDAAKSRRRWRWRYPRAPHPGEQESDDRPPPEEEMAAGTRAAALRSCLRKLAAHVRLAVLLRYEEALTYDEIARMSRERAPAVQARVARALPVLRDCISRYERGAA